MYLVSYVHVALQKVRLFPAAFTVDISNVQWTIRDIFIHMISLKKNKQNSDLIYTGSLSVSQNQVFKDHHFSNPG